jgi:AcrR family transcriptional regulator
VTAYGQNFMSLDSSVPERDRVDRAWFRQPSFPGLLAYLGREVFEARRGGDLEGAQRMRANDEGVRLPHRQQHEVARLGVENPPAAPELHSAVKDIERLVLDEVPVQRRREPGRVDDLDHGEPASGLCARRLDCDQAAEKPQGITLVRVRQVRDDGLGGRHAHSLDRHGLINRQQYDRAVDDVKKPSARRTYRSTVREQGARRTRQAIVAAAGTLFVERGYVATSLAEVAHAAGVARPTAAAAFGSKPALLRQVLDEALAGDDEPVPVAERPWFAPVWQAATTVDVLDAYAGVCTLIGRRAARVFEIVRRAADSSAEVAELWATAQRNRRAGADMVVRRAARVGALRPDLVLPRAVDALWVLNDPALYGALVLDSGWPEDDHRAWLAGQMRAAILPTSAGDH